jgi:hypothetical protein
VMEIYNIIVNNKEDINVTASANTNKTEQDSKSSSGSLGVMVVCKVSTQVTASLRVKSRKMAIVTTKAP